jgi:hypothetical protein
MFSFYRTLVKATIKTDRFRWLKGVDENLKSQPKQFWKYVANFRERNSNSIQLEVDGKHLIQSNDEFLSSASVSDSDVIKAIERLRQSKCVGIDDILEFIIKGCTDIFVRIHKHIFNLSLFEHYFPTLWKQAVIFTVLKKGESTPVSNFRTISLVSIFSKIFEFVIHDHVEHI